MRPLKKALFIDRDGVIVEERQVDSLERVVFIPHVISALRKIREKTDYYFVMVSNQDGVNTPSFPIDDFEICQNKILEVLRGEDVVFDDINIDYSLPEDNCPGRKDMQLARNLGCKGIWLHEKEASCPENVALETNSWLEIASFLTLEDIKGHRTAHVERVTGETSVSLDLDLDGSGKGEIVTGIGFFDHMLQQIVRHSRFDLSARLSGDTWVDEHHSIEDMAICLGRAVSQALGDKRGINRYGFDLLCMDDVHAEVSVDFSGRPELVFCVSFTRDYIGSVSTQMFSHFFKSFCDAAGCNIYASVSSGNAHHQAEALFKAFARAVRMAVKRIPDLDEVVSTKGVLE